MVHEGRPIGVGVERDAEVRTRFHHLPAQGAEMLRERLELAREVAVGNAVELDHVDPELAQQAWNCETADARAAVHHDS